MHYIGRVFTVGGVRLQVISYNEDTNEYRLVDESGFSSIEYRTRKRCRNKLLHKGENAWVLF